MKMGLNTNNRQAFGCTNCQKAGEILKQFGATQEQIAKKLELAAPIKGMTQTNGFYQKHEALARDFLDAVNQTPKIIANNLKIMG